MALNFPGSPTNGQQYQGFVYNSSVQAWQSNPASVAPFYTADTPPTNPTKGDSWFNTNDGTMYIYTYDGNTYQWVEHRSQIARSQVGLVPIVPTSVTISGGTATVSTTGAINFSTGTTGITANGVFTSEYKNYVMVYTGLKNAVAGNDAINFRLTSAGTAAASNYDQAAVAFSSSVAGLQNLGGNAAAALYAARIYQASGYYAGNINIYQPQEVATTKFTGMSYGTTAGDDQQVFNSGVHYINASYDGIYFYPTANSISGQLAFYGYND